MAVVIVLTAMIAIFAVGASTILYYPIIEALQSTPMYQNASVDDKLRIDSVIAYVRPMPAVMIGVIVVWAYLRAARGDQIVS